MLISLGSILVRERYHRRHRPERRAPISEGIFTVVELATSNPSRHGIKRVVTVYPPRNVCVGHSQAVLVVGAVRGKACWIASVNTEMQSQAASELDELRAQFILAECAHEHTQD